MEAAWRSGNRRSAARSLARGVAMGTKAGGCHCSTVAVARFFRPVKFMLWVWEIGAVVKPAEQGNRAISVEAILNATFKSLLTFRSLGLAHALILVEWGGITKDRKMFLMAGGIVLEQFQQGLFLRVIGRIQLLKLLTQFRLIKNVDVRF